MVDAISHWPLEDRVLPAQALLTGAFSRNDSALHGRLVAAFKSNAYWMQYSQCQWNVVRP